MDIETHRENYSEVLGIQLPANVTEINLKVSDDYGVVNEPSFNVDENNVLEFLLPVANRKWDGQVRIDVSFKSNGVVENIFKYVNVVTPYFTESDLSSQFKNSMNWKFEQLEMMVRHIIAAHTGRMFLHLPVQRRDNVYRDNFFNYASSVYEVPIEAVENGVNVAGMYFDVKKDVFYTPKRSARAIVLDQESNGIPLDVHMAAMALAATLACKEDAWRDKYIMIMTSSNWRIQYSEQVFESTGSATADKLLIKYRQDLDGSAWI